MKTYILLSRGLSTLAKTLTTATRTTQSSSNELSTPVSDSAKCEQTKDNTNVLEFLS